MPSRSGREGKQARTETGAGKKAARHPGRPPVEGKALDSMLLVRVTAEQKRAYRSVGGASWLRGQLREVLQAADDSGLIAVRPGSRLVVPMAESAVQAGFPSPAASYEQKDIDFNELLARNPSSTFVLRVRGDSMVDAGIDNGDLIVIDRSEPARDGVIAVVRINNEFTVKRVGMKSGSLVLHPENSTGAYDDILPQGDDEWEFFGIVKHVIRSF